MFPVKPGFWMVRCCRHCPEVAARIWLCDHEPGDPENTVDQPYWQGQIGLDLVPPADVWKMLEFCEAEPEEQRQMADPGEVARAPRSGRRPALTTAPMALWKQQRARRISAAEFEAQIRWLRWAETNAPNRPEFTYRKPVDLAAVPIPRFA
jgi:hypothetical protein